MSLLNFMAAQRPKAQGVQQSGLLATLSNQGKLMQPQQPMMADNSAAQAMQAFQQAQAQARQPIQGANSQKSGGGLGGLMSIFKLLMGGA